jgi:hypothetical protein
MLTWLLLAYKKDDDIIAIAMLADLIIILCIVSAVAEYVTR